MVSQRHTKQRQAVLGVVKLSPQPVSAEEILVRLRRRWSDFGAATVYRNLDRLTKRGEIYRVESDDGVKRYVGHAWHAATFRCQRCGKERSLPPGRLPAYVNQTMWGRQVVFASRLMAQGLCGSCARQLKIRS